MLLVGCPLTSAQRDEQENLVEGVGDRVRRLGEHRGRPGDYPAHALGHRYDSVHPQRNQHRAGGRFARSSDPACSPSDGARLPARRPSGRRFRKLAGRNRARRRMRVPQSGGARVFGILSAAVVFNFTSTGWAYFVSGQPGVRVGTVRVDHDEVGSAHVRQQ